MEFRVAFLVGADPAWRCSLEHRDGVCIRLDCSVTGNSAANTVHNGGHTDLHFAMPIWLCT